jgi:hypothetical protein
MSVESIKLPTRTAESEAQEHREKLILMQNYFSRQDIPPTPYEPMGDSTDFDYGDHVMQIIPFNDPESTPAAAPTPNLFSGVSGLGLMQQQGLHQPQQSSQNQTGLAGLAQLGGALSNIGLLSNASTQAGLVV